MFLTAISFMIAMEVTPAITEESCTKATASISIAQCNEQALRRLELKLDKVYQTTLDSRPLDDPIDQRKNREQLARSQMTWKIYKDETCAYYGGVEGGNSVWVTIMSQGCQIDETKKRITFLENTRPN
jgi:uncharacterized protein YecT (DUF1311 family)